MSLFISKKVETNSTAEVSIKLISTCVVSNRVHVRQSTRAESCFERAELNETIVF